MKHNHNENGSNGERGEEERVICKQCFDEVNAHNSQLCRTCHHAICKKHIKQCGRCQEHICEKDSHQCSCCGISYCKGCLEVSYCYECRTQGCKECIKKNCHACDHLVEIHKESVQRMGILHYKIDYWEKGENCKTDVLVGYQPFQEVRFLLDKKSRIIGKTTSQKFHPIKGFLKKYLRGQG